MMSPHYVRDLTETYQAHNGRIVDQIRIFAANKNSSSAAQLRHDGAFAALGHAEAL